jgi:hypothetical protein
LPRSGAREARVAFAFSWLTKPFESRKIGRCKIDLCFPFSHHEQNKNIAAIFRRGLSVDGAATGESAVGFRSVRVQKGMGDVEAD